MKKIALFSFLLMPCCLSAQVAIKLYQNLDYVNNYTAETSNVADGHQDDFYFQRTSLAIQFANRVDLFHEIEFSYATEAIPVVRLIYRED